MKFKTYKTTAISLVASTLLIGCGGSGSGGSDATTSTSTIGTGTYIDSAIEGVDYVCGSQIGKTDVDGKFNFEKGQDCSFKIGELLLRTVPASSLSDNVQILEDNTRTAQLLQSLDKDGNADNGITILPSAAEMMNDTNIESVPETEVEIDDMVKDLEGRDSNYKGRFVSQEEADVHVAQTKSTMNSNNNASGNMNNNGSGNMNDNSAS